MFIRLKFLTIAFIHVVLLRPAKDEPVGFFQLIDQLESIADSSLLRYFATISFSYLIKKK
jgi:hypothetical protein